MAEPGWPYRDKTVTFPPVSYLAFEAIEAHGTATTGGRLLVLTQLAGDLVVAAALAAGWGRRAAAAWLALLLPLLWDGWVLARIDLLSVALALGGLALVRRRATTDATATAGGIALAASALAKVWSVALLPGLFVERQHRAGAGHHGDPGRGRRWCGWPSGASAGCSMSCSSVARAAGRSRARSAPSSTWRPVVPCGPKGALWRIGTEPAGVGALLGLATLAAIAAAWWLAARRPDGPAPDRARLAAVGAVLVLAPVLSPQYLVWLLPFVAVLAADAVVLVLGGAATVAHRRGGPRLRRLRGRLALVGVGRRRPQRPAARARGGGVRPAGHRPARAPSAVARRSQHPARRPGPSLNGFPGPGSPAAIAARRRPISGTNLKPWPEKPAPTTSGPDRSSTKSSVGVDV